MTHTLHLFAVTLIVLGLGTFAVDVIVTAWSRAAIRRRALRRSLEG